MTETRKAKQMIAEYLDLQHPHTVPTVNIADQYIYVKHGRNHNHTILEESTVPATDSNFAAYLKSKLNRLWAV
jgi:hypothetical protein